jgi:hypothetical protein
MNQANETWIPRCPNCSEGNLVLAPANGFTRNILDKVEIYCTNCRYRGKLSDDLAKVYIRA